MSNEWFVYSLQDCLEVVIDYRGKTPKKLGGSWCDEGYRAISANNVKFSGLVKQDSIRCLDEVLYKKWMKEEVQYGDILLTSEAPAGQVMLWNSKEKIVLSQRIYALRTNKKVYNHFLKYYLQSSAGQNQITRNNSGSTVSGISAKTFSNIIVRFPKEFDTQVAIGDLLYSLDTKIELNNRINTELEAMAKTLYDYWFVQFDFPDENGKPYKSSGGRMEYNEALKREIPAGWETGQLDNWVSFKRGISYKSSEIQDTGVPFLNLNSFSLQGDFKFEGTKYFNGKFKESARLHAGELVIAITDVTRNADIIGKSFIVPNIFSESPLMSCDVAQVIAKDNSYIYYLQMLFNSKSFHDHVKYYASGTLVLHLNLNGINWFYDILPPDSIMDKFALLRKATLDRQYLNIMENQQLAKLRDWLLPMLMNIQLSYAG